MSVHVFDADHTLVRGSMARWFVGNALAAGIITLRQMAKFPVQWVLYKLAILDPAFLDGEFLAFRDLPLVALEELASRSFADHGSGQIFREATDLIERIRGENGRIVIATSSPAFLVRPLAEFLGITDVIATQLEFVDGKSTGRVVGHAAFGEHKKTAVQRFFREHALTLAQATFYSDSYYDAPLLEACGTAVVVNPDRRLRRLARKREWKRFRFCEVIGS